MSLMSNADLSLNRGIVFASALVYWAGVYVQARRVRRRIGRSPNVRPRGAKERLLWAGWLLIVLSWLALPFLVGAGTFPAFFTTRPSLCVPLAFFFGIVWVVAGYVGTLWCYAAMGSAWRMGVNRAEKTPLVKNGPFKFVRHPIYLFQAFMLVGMVLLLPAPASLAVLALHVICIRAKAADEESYLSAVHGHSYHEYLSHTGKFLPRLRPNPKSCAT